MDPRGILNYAVENVREVLSTRTFVETEEDAKADPRLRAV